MSPQVETQKLRLWAKLALSMTAMWFMLSLIAELGFHSKIATIIFSFMLSASMSGTFLLIGKFMLSPDIRDIGEVFYPMFNVLALCITIIVIYLTWTEFALYEDMPAVMLGEAVSIMFGITTFGLFLMSKRKNNIPLNEEEEKGKRKKD